MPTPSQAKIGTSSEHTNWDNSYWHLQTVNWIVRDRQYIGSTVFGKRVRDQIGVCHQVKARQEDWIVVDDRHEPLVSKELFQRAQETLGGAFKQTKGYVVYDNPLRKKVYCGVCGYAIIRRGKKDRYYCCRTPRTIPDLECCQEKVYEGEVFDVVTDAIRTQASYAVDVEHIMEKRKEQQEKSLRAFQKELQGLCNTQEQLSNQGDKLYEDFFEGKISREAYIEQKAVLCWATPMLDSPYAPTPTPRGKSRTKQRRRWAGYLPKPYKSKKWKVPGGRQKRPSGAFSSRPTKYPWSACHCADKSIAN